MEFYFVADVHLGKLARLLRLLGWDTLYENTFTTDQMIAITTKENRILLSKNSSFYKSAASNSFFQILFDDPYDQLKQVETIFRLLEISQPFTRCMVCNGRLHEVDKQSILPLLSTNTAKYYDAFWQCHKCKQVYWKGPHYNRMQNILRSWQEWE